MKLKFLRLLAIAAILAAGACATRDGGGSDTLPGPVSETPVVKTTSTGGRHIAIPEAREIYTVRRGGGHDQLCFDWTSAPKQCLVANFVETHAHGLPAQESVRGINDWVRHFGLHPTQPCFRHELSHFVGGTYRRTHVGRWNCEKSQVGDTWPVELRRS
jgi:hypothetical protein